MSRLVCARWSLASGSSALSEAALAFGLASFKLRFESVVQQDLGWCCTPASACTAHRAGGPRVNGAGELCSVQAQPYAVDQLDSDSFQQADERHIFCSGKALQTDGVHYSFCRRAWMNCEKDGKPNKEVSLHWNTPMASNCSVCWKFWKITLCDGNSPQKKTQNKKNPGIPPESFFTSLLLIFHQAEQFDQDQKYFGGRCWSSSSTLLSE